MGSGYGPRQDFVERYARLEEMVRQLRIRSAQHPTRTDLAGYLAAGFSVTGFLGSGGVPGAFFYVDRGRCWLGGSVYYTDASNTAAGTLLGTALPPNARPAGPVRITFDIDGDNSAFTPTPDLAGGQYGATIQATVTNDAHVFGGGRVVFSSEGACNAGILKHSGGTAYGGLPSDSALQLDGISWPVREATP